MDDDLLLPGGSFENHFPEPGEALGGAILARVADPPGDECSLLGPDTTNVVHDHVCLDYQLVRTHHPSFSVTDRMWDLRQLS